MSPPSLLASCWSDRSVPPGRDHLFSCTFVPAALKCQYERLCDNGRGSTSVFDRHVHGALVDRRGLLASGTAGQALLDTPACAVGIRSSPAAVAKRSSTTGLDTQGLGLDRQCCRVPATLRQYRETPCSPRVLPIKDIGQRYAGHRSNRTPRTGPRHCLKKFTSPRTFLC